jgi:hypothetical protein
MNSEQTHDGIDDTMRSFYEQFDYDSAIAKTLAPSTISEAKQQQLDTIITENKSAREACASLLINIRDGLAKEFLTEDEKSLLIRIIGEDWETSEYVTNNKKFE